MLRSLSSGVSGMLANQTEMDVIGNNIANSNTTGFKSSTADFAESFLQVSRAPTTSQPVGLAVGLGTTVTSTTTNFGQGVFQTTNVPSDIAINGTGWFTTQNASGADFLTRAGAFTVDSNGYFRTSNGNFLMGSMGATAPTTPVAGFPSDKIQIPTTIGSTTEQVVGYTIDQTGAITVTGSAGTTETVGYVTLQHYPNDNGLIDQGGGNYSYDPAAGTNQYYLGGQAGTGTMQTGVLEASNVDLSTEFTNMIAAQSGFNANARIITVSDSMLQTITDLKRQ